MYGALKFTVTKIIYYLFFKFFCPLPPSPTKISADVHDCSISLKINLKKLHTRFQTFELLKKI